jgi:hypothetical protein
MASSINASTSGAGGVITTADSSGVLNIQTAGNTAVTVDASQNVGIGTTSPTARIHAEASNPTRGILSRVRNSASSSQTGAQIQLTQNGIEDWAIGQPAATNAFAFWSGRSESADGTERMRIDSSGHVYIGTTNSAPRDFTSGGGCVIKPPANTFEFASSDTNPVFLNYTGSASGSATFITFRQQGAGRGSISTNGSTTAYNTTSDYRLKENIAPMTGALNKVTQLKPVIYTWKETSEQGQGFIAHELQEHFPDAVSGEKDAVDEDGKPVYQGIDTSFLVATLTAAIQEQQTIINDLKARIETLEAK